MELRRNAQRERSRIRLLGRDAALVAPCVIIRDRVCEGLLQFIDVLAREMKHRARVDHAPMHPFIAVFISDLGDITFMCEDHGFIPAFSKNWRTLAMAPLSVSGLGWAVCLRSGGLPCRIGFNTALRIATVNAKHKRTLAAILPGLSLPMAAGPTGGKAPATLWAPPAAEGKVAALLQSRQCWLAGAY